MTESLEAQGPVPSGRGQIQAMTDGIRAYSSEVTDRDGISHKVIAMDTEGTGGSDATFSLPGVEAATATASSLGARLAASRVGVGINLRVRLPLPTAPSPSAASAWRLHTPGCCTASPIF